MIRLSKRMSSWLRHHPEAIGLEMDGAGWVRVDELLAKAAARGQAFSRAQLEEVVAENTKKRFEFDETETLIRARQGHSIPVELGYATAEPPEVLFHGTAQNTLTLIWRDGLLPMKRHAVHLSPDKETAVKVGSRHGKPAVLAVAAARMHAEGYTFFVTGNGVWLTDAVPAEYLREVPALG
ncbi:Phosphate acetyltransferase [Catenulispora acidiphila DSM 44928]|uniref:Probable RNA 2'-phosphotransferase n=2 Tax=Catenulispora TaxID=414878 RepID=C7QAQ2_CATAD|nr:Phosphate acetyltransferase [Catenulispora acidiphila DSM 44928]